MTVQELMKGEVQTVAPGASLADAARTMWEHDIGFLPVVEPQSGALLGVVTDRDACMAALMQGCPLHLLTVEQAMATSVQSCRPEDHLERVHELMRRHQIHRVPVCDDGGRVVGVLSLNDLAMNASRERGNRHQQLCAEVGETLAAVCQPRALAGVG